MCCPAVAEALTRHRPVLLYTIPTYQNPTGRTLSHTRRQQLLVLAEQHDFHIVAVEVYHLLDFGSPPPRSLRHLLQTVADVLSLGSFSKILAPGLRLGWVQTTAAAGASIRRQRPRRQRRRSQPVHLKSGARRPRRGRAERNTWTASAAPTNSASRPWTPPSANTSATAPPGPYPPAASSSGSPAPITSSPPPTAQPSQTPPAGSTQPPSWMPPPRAKVGFLPGTRCSSVGGLNHCLRLCFAHYPIPRNRRRHPPPRPGLRHVPAHPISNRCYWPVRIR